MNNVFIFHGTEGYPEENWFPWLKQELEQRGCKVFVPQFPSPPIVSAKIAEWFDVLKNYEQYINENTIFIGHSLGGIFTLRILEKLEHPVKAAFLLERLSAFSLLQITTEIAVLAVLLSIGKQSKRKLNILMFFNLTMTLMPV